MKVEVSNGELVDNAYEIVEVEAEPELKWINIEFYVTDSVRS